MKPMSQEEIDERTKEAAEHVENATHVAVIVDGHVVNLIRASPGFCEKHLPEGHAAVQITDEHGFVDIGHRYNGKAFVAPEKGRAVAKSIEERFADLEAEIATLKAKK